MPLENVRRFRGELESLGKRASVRVFGGIGHGWFNVTRPKDYDEAASNESWDLLDAFAGKAFAGTLGGSPLVEFNADASVPFDFSV